MEGGGSGAGSAYVRMRGVRTCVNMCAGRFVVPFELDYVYQVSLAKILQDAGNASCQCVRLCVRSRLRRGGLGRFKGKTLSVWECHACIHVSTQSGVHVSIAVDSIWLCV